MSDFSECKLYPTDVRGVRGVSSGSEATWMPNQYAPSKERFNGTWSPRAVLKRPWLTLNVFVSLHSALPPLEEEYNLKPKL